MPTLHTRLAPAAVCFSALLGLLAACTADPAGGPAGTARPTDQVANASAQAPSAVSVQAVGQRGSSFLSSALHSRHTGITYPYSVCLPAGYTQSAATYPVVYTTDGQWGAMDLCKVADSKNKAVILVMIHQGPGNRRSVDYYGAGATAYTRFFKGEMVPLIESGYRTNGDRSYYGVSAGGIFGAILLADEPVGEPFFRRYILADGTFQLLSSQNIEQESARFRASDRLNVTIFVTGTARGNLKPTLAFFDRYKSRAYKGITLRSSQYAVPHVEMSYPTFVEAIDLYF